jgi:alpha-1,6-mannosyltransferase
MFAVILFAGSSLALAMAGPRLVPATSGGSPRWLLGPYGDGLRVGGPTFLVCLAISFVAYLGILAGVEGLTRGFVWSLIVVAVTAFLLAPPLLSQDVFSYIAYARLGAAHGLNPYGSVPADVPRDAVLPFVGWRESTSAYGPLLTLSTYPLGLVGVPLAFWLFKILTALSVLGLTWLAAYVAASRGGSSARAAAFVGLNPLVLVHVVGGAHCDGAMVLVLIGGIAILARNETLSGSALIGASAVKASAAFALPFALVGSRSRKSLLTGASIMVALTVTATLLAFGSKAFGAVGPIEQDQALTSRYSVPSAVARLVGTPLEFARITALVILALSLVYLLVRTARTFDWLLAAGWAALGLLAATSWLLPWYVIWVVPIAAIVDDGWLTAGTLVLCAFQLVNRVPL